MTPALQAKLLRFLEEKAFKRMGGARDVTVDVRVVGPSSVRAAARPGPPRSSA